VMAADIVGTKGSGDVELSIAEEVLATTEAHWAPLRLALQTNRELEIESLLI